jgi:PAS domain S-box-containing protein
MPRILLVSDDLANTRVVSAKLAEQGFDVKSASDAESALECIAAESFDLLLTGLMLPGQDGIELCRQIKQDPQRRRLPVVVLTASREASDVLRALEAGADDYLSKDRPMTDIVARLRQIIRRGCWPLFNHGGEPTRVKFLDREYAINAGHEQLLDVLLSAFEDLARLNMQCEQELAARRQAEQELLESEARQRAIFESALDCILVIDEAGTVIEFNRAAEKQFDCARKAAIGKDFAELFVPPTSRPRYHKNLAHYTGTGEAGSLVGRRSELIMMRKNGERFLAEWVMQPFPLHDKSAFAVFLHDITERKRAERKLERYARELKRSNKDLSEFAYAASHDLQEPLRMVKSYCQLLQRRYQGQLDESANEFIGYAVDGVNRMQVLIDGLLSYSRVNTRGKPFEPTDCSALLRDVLANLEVAIQESGATVTCESLPTVMADRTQMLQMFQNLIGNAIKFRGEAPPQVRVRGVRKGREWIFSVRDNGIGIEPQNLEKVFVIFQRLHTREEYPGHGMGLALCKRIVERHGGRIWAESQPGQGSVFKFTLPVAPAPRISG